jgi:glycosyltransferase involved in cell wall biosynthesis
MASIPERLELLFVTLYPASPARYGAQRRIQGLMEAMSRRHGVTAISLVTPDVDAEEARRAMSEYCHEVILVPARDHFGRSKRFLQAASMLTPYSFERLWYDVPALRSALHRTLSRRRFDVVDLEAPCFAHLPVNVAPPGARLPRRIVDQHNIEFDLLRQMADSSQQVTRRVYNQLNWPKMRREEIAAWRALDGILFTSATDEARARALVPSLPSAVVPNAVDVRSFQPSASYPEPDGRTIMFFGAIDYFPNSDGIGFFLREVWPTLARTHPQAKLKIVGLRPTPEVLAARSDRVEVTGVVDDLRPHLAGAEMVMAPLRVGGGTRFKILEAMAMAKPIVSTALGAEGIDVVHDESILLADSPGDFAAALGRLLDDRALGRKLGQNGRTLVERRYSWDAATQHLEGFLRGLLGRPRVPAHEAPQDAALHVDGV